MAAETKTAQKLCEPVCLRSKRPHIPRNLSQYMWHLVWSCLHWQSLLTQRLKPAAVKRWFSRRRISRF